MTSEKEKAALDYADDNYPPLVKNGCYNCLKDAHLAGDKSGYARAMCEIMTAVCDAVSNCGVCPIYGAFCCGLDGKGHGKCPSKRDKHPPSLASNGKPVLCETCKRGTCKGAYFTKCADFPNGVSDKHPPTFAQLQNEYVAKQIKKGGSR